MGGGKAKRGSLWPTTPLRRCMNESYGRHSRLGQIYAAPCNLTGPAPVALLRRAWRYCGGQRNPRFDYAHGDGG